VTDKELLEITALELDSLRGEIAELESLRAWKAEIERQEPVATYMGTDWDASKQFMAECARLDNGTKLYAAPVISPDVAKLRKLNADTGAQWSELYSRADAELVSLRKKLKVAREAIDWCVAEINRDSPAALNGKKALATIGEE